MNLFDKLNLTTDLTCDLADLAVVFVAGELLHRRRVAEQRLAMRLPCRARALHLCNERAEIRRPGGAELPDETLILGLDLDRNEVEVHHRVQDRTVPFGRDCGKQRTVSLTLAHIDEVAKACAHRLQRLNLRSTARTTSKYEYAFVPTSIPP
jgi:hypothetical protein